LRLESERRILSSEPEERTNLAVAVSGHPVHHEPGFPYHPAAGPPIHAAHAPDSGPVQPDRRRLRHRGGNRRGCCGIFAPPSLLLFGSHDVQDFYFSSLQQATE
jgi:hypothetical protein